MTNDPGDIQRTPQSDEPTEPVGDENQIGDGELPPVEPPSPRFIAQLFLIPALIVGGIVGLVLFFGWVGSGTRDWLDGLARSLVSESKRTARSRPNPILANIEGRHVEQGRDRYAWSETTAIKDTRVRTMTIYGGVSEKPQIQKLSRKVDVICACPGRLLDLLGRGFVDLSRIDTLILDEADHMFDMGFLPDIKRIIAQLPSRRQNLLL